ncbi:MAG: glycosyltransferase [Verrucomicrobiae bacterium]|nr:glycosyltransferase [Verrucomicrobiae bacterium]
MNPLVPQLTTLVESPGGIMLLYQAGVTLVLAALFLNLLWNLRYFIRPRPQTPPHNAPMISVCIPARNEALRIGNLLRSLSRQDYPNFEVVILNDHSEDDTEKVIESYRGDLPRLKVIRGQSLPAGWVGKCWACHQAGRQAEGEYLLFTDADTVHAPTSLSSAYHAALEHRSGMLSLWPRQIAETWSEKLIIPFIYLLLLVFLPHGLANRVRNGSMGAANGQFVFFHRRDYDRLGGHESVRHHLVEDVALARATIRAGLRMVNLDGCRQVECRMYHRFADLWEGFTKNLRAAFEDNVAGFVFFGVVQLTVFVMPFGFLLLCLLPGNGGVPGLLSLYLVLAQIVMIALIRLVFALRFHQSVAWAVLHPVGQILALVIALNSWYHTSFRGAVTWKGRRYET